MLLPLLALLLVAYIVTTSLSFDALVRVQYARHRADWEASGRPRGHYWVAPDVKRRLLSWLTGGGWAFQRAYLSWLFRTPVWINGDEAARKLHKRWRLLAAPVFVLGAISGVAAFGVAIAAVLDATIY